MRKVSVQQVTGRIHSVGFCQRNPSFCLHYFSFLINFNIKTVSLSVSLSPCCLCAILLCSGCVDLTLLGTFFNTTSVVSLVLTTRGQYCPINPFLLFLFFFFGLISSFLPPIPYFAAFSSFSISLSISFLYFLSNYVHVIILSLSLIKLLIFLNFSFYHFHPTLSHLPSVPSPFHLHLSFFSLFPLVRLSAAGRRT